MKLKGTKLERHKTVAREECIIPKYGGQEAWVFMVCAPPLTLNRTMLKLLPEPVAPQKILKKEDSEEILLNFDRKPIRYNDESDPDFKAQSHLRILRKNAWMAYAALEFEESLEFDNTTPEKMTVQSVSKWLDDLNEEFELAGFSTGDIALIIETSMKLCNLWEKDVEEARDSFLSQRSKVKEKQKSGSSRKKRAGR